MDPSISLAAQICCSSVSDMPQELARHLFETGAFLIFTDVPEGTEFGIDYKSWHVGPKFSGLKMIPPGVHFIFFSVKTAPRIGFFHYFKEKEIVVRKWDHLKEDMLTEPTTAEEVTRIRANLKNIDNRLGAYPYETYRSWFALSNYIKEKSIMRLKPEDERGSITGQAELVTLESEVEANLGMSTSRVDREHPTRFRFADENGLPIMRIKQGFKIRFTPLESPLVSDSHVVEIGFDRSAQLDKIIATFDGDSDEVLAEIQFAFVCFLMGQVYESFEQWKRLIHLLCSCSKALTTYSNLYMALLPVIHFQLKECPKDFFVDIVSRDNFLTTVLSRLFANIEDSESADASLKEKSEKFKNFLTKRFRWNFDNPEE
ncbi:Protein AAR2 -like protein [Toxocara canis]|uniref:Protein AAR2 homolog n=1 Tax=Toxocara canis TaxID=6265 RepID=A0A0B2USL7_TOXCA|nr:Protein AAR2 -like protein [Toxocara canis]